MEQFLNSIKFYFERIADFTTYGVIFLISLSYIMLIKPKKMEKKDYIKLGIIFLSSYAFLFFESGLMFGIASITNPFVYNYNLALMVLIFAFFALKEKPITKSIKMIILISAICVVDALSKYAGILVGLFTDISIIISFGRMLPSLLFLFTCILINRIDISKYNIFSKETVIICYALAIVLIIASAIEHHFDLHDVYICTLMSLLDIILLLILDTTYFAIYSIVQSRHKITNLEVEKTLVEAQNLSIAIDKNNREELEKLRHDLKNQLSYLNLLLKQDKKEEAIEYINNYVNNQEVLSSFSCSNDVINSILDLELTKAKVYNIKLSLKVAVPPVLPFEDNDIVSLLTNMVDNALENYYGESKITPVSICILKQNDYIRFFVSNPIDITKYDKNNILKSKKNKKGHGYGTKIIQNIAKKYNGYIDFNIDNNRFICDVLLYLNLEDK